MRGDGGTWMEGGGPWMEEVLVRRVVASFGVGVGDQYSRKKRILQFGKKQCIFRYQMHAPKEVQTLRGFLGLEKAENSVLLLGCCRIFPLRLEADSTTLVALETTRIGECPSARTHTLERAGAVLVVIAHGVLDAVGDAVGGCCCLGCHAKVLKKNACLLAFFGMHACFKWIIVK